MGGDFSRETFDPRRGFSGIGMQQGRIVTDADFNEFVAIVDRRMRAGTVDAIGRAIVPLETKTGFEIRLAPGPKLSIGRGRMYVDGHLAENHGRIGAAPAKPILDRARIEPDGTQTGVLDEMISTQPNDFIDYAAQPYLPKPPVLPAAGPHIAYLKVWEREVTAVKDPRLLEPALGGADTATRSQTVWQVRLLENVGAGATCGSQSSKWDTLIAPSPARLTTDTMDVEDPEDPCVIPPGGGYRGLENHFYRVEIHTGGTAGGGGAAKFKWSRDNASVATRIESIEPGNRVRVSSLGPDSTRQFAVGDWTEITDDHREFNGLSGDMRRIVAISGTDEIELSASLSLDLVPVSPDSTAARATRIIRWEQQGNVRLADGSLHMNLDATTDGLIPVPAGGKAVQLEAGITVSFTTEPANGVLRALDHWSFAARTEGAQIEILDAAPPAIHHHYARLAVVTFPSSVSDCRIFWPPAEECGCTVCVSAEGHNSNRYTIQDAIADLPATGGTVCLGPGDFILGATPVVIANRDSIRLRGHGFGSELAYAGAGGAIRLSSVNDVRITDLAVSVASAPAGALGPDSMESSAVHIADGVEVSISRTRLIVASGEGGNDYGVSFEGTAVDLRIEENWIVAVTGIAFRGTGATPPAANDVGSCMAHNLRIADNFIQSPRAGISLDGLIFHLGPVTIEANAILAGRMGISATGAGLGVDVPGSETPGENWGAAGLRIQGNKILFARGGTGVASGLLDLRVIDNDIVAGSDTVGSDTGSCIRLVPGGIPLMPADAQIVGNRLGNVDGYALSIEASQMSLLVKQNVMRDCEEGAVTVGPNVSIRSLSFDNNLIERVATREAPERRTGVGLSGVADARIVGNSVRGVGAAAAGAVNCIGFDINGVARLDLSHNLITDVGPGVQNASSIGIFVHGAVLACTITANHIFDTRGAIGQGTGNWCAIDIRGQSGSGQRNLSEALILTEMSSSMANAINQAVTSLGAGAATAAASRSAGATTGSAAVAATEAAAQPAAAAAAATGTPPPSFPPAMPANFATANTIFTLGTNRLWAFAPVGEMEIRIAGNMIEDAHPNSNTPMVRVEGGAGNCVFTDNQCTRRAPGPLADPAVRIQIARIVASNNIIRRPFLPQTARGPSMQLFCAGFSPTPAAAPVAMATVVGNLTAGTIFVNNNLLQPPFAPLNLQTN